ncbi:FAD-dependent monooxygenase [Pedobacter antarcticus]|uniref:FAD binding domain-containing protein n=1 Tax=Pedobacter antarcticus TaxID=34086 RepID=UPI00292E3B08|nr:FAD-dependent monooxygenase [Pedobacter antarcticus]
MADKKLKIGIIGGSLGGLFTGIALQKSGHQVTIYEKTGEKLKDRGAGVVLQQELIDFFQEYQINRIENINVPIYQRVYVDRNGRQTRVDNSKQQMTAWGTLFHELIKNFPASQYNYGHSLKNLSQANNQVSVEFDNGKVETFDLLIGADGTNSTVRKIVFPEILLRYAGYVGWRGIVHETELPTDVLNELIDRFTFYSMPNSHILCYLIPGNDDEVSPGSRRINWVWYWNVNKGQDIDDLLTDINGIKRSGFVPEGLVMPEYIKAQKEIADEVMPPIFKELIRATKNPFIQPVNDLAVTKMYSNRVVLIGDAAFTPRPHTAASTAKAVANGINLSQSLKDFPDDIEQALAFWEQPQLDMGNYLKNRGVALGNQSQFGTSLRT